jgi:hypothetical protein
MKWYEVKWHVMTMCFPWGLLDDLAHMLHLPRFIQRPLCDRVDLALGVTREELSGGS